MERPSCRLDLNNPPTAVGGICVKQKCRDVSIAAFDLTDNGKLASSLICTYPETVLITS
jgi:hypothetical protein